MESTQANNASAKIVSALIIGLLVGFAAGVFWQSRRAPISETMAATAAAKKEIAKTDTAAKDGSIPSVVDMGANAKTDESMTAKGLVVADQTAGGTVAVASIDAKEIIWVAVREETDGKLGNILGAQKVFIGDGQQATVELLRPTLAGKAYRVVAYRDVGAPAFNYREDVLIEGVDAKFMAK